MGKGMKEVIIVKITKWIAVAGLLVMTGVISYGFVIGNFRNDGAELLSNPWGIVSMVDLYVGFILFSMWIVFRESNYLSATSWVVLMMVLGNFTACIYVLYAVNQSKGNWEIFFMGKGKKLEKKKYILSEKGVFLWTLIK